MDKGLLSAEAFADIWSALQCASHLSVVDKWDRHSTGDTVWVGDWRLNMISYNVRNNTRCPCVAWQSSLVLKTKYLLVEVLFSFLKTTFQVQSTVQATTFWFFVHINVINHPLLPSQLQAYQISGCNKKYAANFSSYFGVTSWSNCFLTNNWKRHADLFFSAGLNFKLF